MKSIRLFAATMMIAASASAPAWAESVSISARASTICRVDVAGALLGNLPAGETRIGRMTELCNSADGYRLVLHHPRGLEGAALVIDGQRIALAANADETVISDHDLPMFRERDVSISLQSEMTVAGLAFEAQPKGMIY